MIDAATYERERAICDKAQAYARATMATRGPKCCYITAEEALHPDYAACDNAMRGRVEQYEVLRDMPDRFCAYAGAGRVQTGAGDDLGALHWTSSRRIGGYVSSRYYYGRAIIGGVHYSAQGHGKGMYLILRKLKNQPKGVAA
jgi:hypothetical protein